MAADHMFEVDDADRERIVSRLAELGRDRVVQMQAQCALPQHWGNVVMEWLDDPGASPRRENIG